MIGMAFGISPLPESIIAMPEWPDEVLFQGIRHLPEAFELGIVMIVVTFLFVDLFDTTGTLTGVGSAAGFLDEKGQLPRAKQAFLADGVGTSVGALLGTSTVTAYIESASGISEGAKTGRANYVTAALFLLAIPFFPIAKAIPAYATAPALVVVGVMMCSQMGKVRWNDIAEGIPAVVVMIGIPLTFSIADGLALALVIYPILMAGGGRWREVHWFGWILAILVILRYALL
jgi:adenine/guanine/hypoxanthine permease